MYSKQYIFEDNKRNSFDFAPFKLQYGDISSLSQRLLLYLKIKSLCKPQKWSTQLIFCVLTPAKTRSKRKLM